MANLLNAIITNSTLKPNEHSFSYDSSRRVKPLKDKAALLPSRIIGSPVEYAKDLAKDVISIGKAVKGKANDHELGRINSLAMKLGSLGIASYLFVKNPFKLSKVMEFAGFGAFFASMSLWPKLAIQLPLKARTGVDFMQEYVDSQGRKKMLYQDPQYVLTDLLPRKDLDTIGRKMKISEELPDRDNFIKQRARKTALQANTLWMMTAGAAAPVMSALVCNAGERILKPALEKYELNKTKRDFLISDARFEDIKAKQAAAAAKFEKFLINNSNKPLKGEIADIIAAQIDPMLEESGAMQLREPLRRSLENLTAGEINKSFLERTFGKEVIASLDENYASNLNTYLKRYQRQPFEAMKKISNLLAKSGVLGETSREDILFKMKEEAQTVTVGELMPSLKELYSAMIEFTRSKKLLDAFVDARSGDRAGSFIANQWAKTCGRFLNSFRLGFSSEGLKKIAGRDTEFLDKQMAKLAASPEDFNKALKDIVNLVYKYEEETKADMIFPGSLLYNTKSLSSKELMKQRKTNRAHLIFNELRASLNKFGFFEISQEACGGSRPLNMPPAPGTIQKALINNAEMRVLGAQSSFFRVIQALEIYKQAQTGVLKAKLANFAREEMKETAAKMTPEEFDALIARLEEHCKNIIMNASTVDYIEKFKSRGFELTEGEYKTVMRTMFDEKTILDDLLAKAGASKDISETILAHYRDYKADFLTHVVNWKNNMRPDLASRILKDIEEQSLNAARRNGLTGKNLTDMLAETAQSKYNSKQWMLLFGGIMAGLTAVTLAAGLMLGRKDKVEKQAEIESRNNV